MARYMHGGIEPEQIKEQEIVASFQRYQLAKQVCHSGNTYVTMQINEEGKTFDCLCKKVGKSFNILKASMLLHGMISAYNAH